MVAAMEGRLSQIDLIACTLPHGLALWCVFGVLRVVAFDCSCVLCTGFACCTGLRKAQFSNLRRSKLIMEHSPYDGTAAARGTECTSSSHFRVDSANQRLAVLLLL